jgi:hypothetical protein
MNIAPPPQLSTLLRHWLLLCLISLLLPLFLSITIKKLLYIFSKTDVPVYLSAVRSYLMPVYVNIIVPCQIRHQFCSIHSWANPLLYSVTLSANILSSFLVIISDKTNSIFLFSR